MLHPTIPTYILYFVYIFVFHIKVFHLKTIPEQTNYCFYLTEEQSSHLSSCTIYWKTKTVDMNLWSSHCQKAVDPLHVDNMWIPTNTSEFKFHSTSKLTSLWLFVFGFHHRCRLYTANQMLYSMIMNIIPSVSHWTADNRTLYLLPHICSKFSYKVVKDDAFTLHIQSYNRRFMDNCTLYWPKIDHLDNVFFCILSLLSFSFHTLYISIHTHALCFFIQSKIEYLFLHTVCSMLGVGTQFIIYHWRRLNGH